MEGKVPHLHQLQQPAESDWLSAEAGGYREIPVVGQPLEIRPFNPGVEKKLDVSIVIPLLNEEESLIPLCERLKAMLDEWGRTVEVICIDDGSTDRTFAVLKKIQAEDSRFRVIRFRRNFGQTAAFSAGFDFARGEIIVTLDGDLQNDPDDIPKLVEKVEEGFDVVSGWRLHRQDAFLSRCLPSQVANALISRVTGVKLHDYGCSLKAYRKEVVKNVHLYGDMHRFIPALASWMGIQVAEMPVNHYRRQFGRSKYGIGRTVKVLLDLLTVKFLLDYSTRPIQIFGLLGLTSFGIGTVWGIYLVIQRMFFNMPLGDRPALLVSVLLVMIGVQLTIMGLLGELLVRIYHEAQGKRIYMVREILGAE